jgi:hypothetical protein
MQRYRARDSGRKIINTSSAVCVSVWTGVRASPARPLGVGGCVDSRGPAAGEPPVTTRSYRAYRSFSRFIGYLPGVFSLRPLPSENSLPHDSKETEEEESSTVKELASWFIHSVSVFHSSPRARPSTISIRCATSGCNRGTAAPRERARQFGL